MKKNKVALAVLTCLAGISSAQTVPDAGALLNQYKQESAQKQDAAAPVQDGRAQVFKGFGFVDLTAEQAQQARQITQAYVGQEVIPGALIKYLEMQMERRHGISLVFVPLPDGQLKAIRPVLGAIHIDNQSKLSDALLRRTLTQGIETGQALNRMALEARSMVANEIPGVVHQYRMVPGTAVGSTDLQVTTTDAKPADGYWGFDSNGTTAVGIWQAMIGFSVNNAMGAGERLSLHALQTQNGQYVGLQAEAPVRVNDLRVGLSASHYGYDYATSGTSQNGTALISNYLGGARAVGLNAHYALTRSEFERSHLSLALDRKENHSDADIHATAFDGSTQTANYRLSNWLIESVSTGYHRMAALPNRARVSYGLTASYGNARQQNESAALADTDAARQQGRYAKVHLHAEYAQPWRLSQHDLVFTASAAGQWSDKNLPNSEKFTVGGLSMMKAWSPQVTSGDQAMWLELKLEKYIQPQLKLGLFAEVAQIKSQHTPYGALAPDRTAVWLDDKNTLSDVGVMATYAPQPSMELVGSLAVKTSGEPKAYKMPIASTNKQHGDVMGFVRLMYRF